MSRLGQHDGDGIRYAMHLSAPKGGSAQMLRDPAGGWVSWEDYARLYTDAERYRLASLRVDVGELHAQFNQALFDETIAENARLKAEVERLTNLKSGADYFKAKEGKQS